MSNPASQNTIAHVAHVSGRGYWSGQPVTLTFLPAAPNTGVVFRRTDLTGRPSVPALAEYREDAALRTKLVRGDAKVEMIEHVMAALYGMRIDNCIVECDAAEMPGMDGSSHAIAIALDRAGIESQSALATSYRIRSMIRIGDDRSGIVAVPSREPRFSAQYTVDYGPSSTIPQSTSTHIVDRETFLNEIAPARTFLTQREADMLREQGVAGHVTYRDLLVFGPHGPIDNVMRFVDECSRHKLLDLVGDIALCGVRIEGAIIAQRSGHNMNGQMARELAKLHNEESKYAVRAA